ncbi:hypothetical protein F2Q69_00003920 [Brassica cretica]|uniref:Ubiquitin carboxyl-terminal hydrolase n=1 Tax=Brassica cretica TaxID=69181 RepID=A0A8S9P5F6_BRACR|nr:hypothetical protein F2Q69_00003920 [Brassica cretica]
MELLRSNLSRVQIPEPTHRIYKHECCLSFDTPVKPLSTPPLLVYFIFNRRRLFDSVYDFQRSEGGVDGGFDNSEPEYEESYSIVILPDFVSLPFPSVELPEKVRIAVDTVMSAVGAEKREQVAAWTAEEKKVSEHALTLQQIKSGVVIPPSGWKCSKCDKTENLWLNLTDGMILCGRKNWDGTGGNNHAVEHYKETNYPLAVKLGTITADLEAADVYSYPEDDSVLDPHLAQHLAHFGIDFSTMQKTEMTTAERELDQNTNFDWNRIQESGKELVPVFGPGYTGLVNLGNSCYLAATMQILFSTHSFISRYFSHQSLKLAFEMAPADPTLDINMQLTKLGHGLLSGKYSIPVAEKDVATGDVRQEGIPPRMFKSVVAAGHAEFSSMRQQDALDFFLHLLDKVERGNNMRPDLDPSRSFKFGVEEKILCSSGKVSYNKRDDCILSLNIPLQEATNKDELEAFNNQKADKGLEEDNMSTDEIVRPRVPLEACLATFSSPEQIRDYYSTALKGKTTAIKTTSLTSFPDYLVLHMRKFVMEAGWVPKKLDVYIDVPDVIDISHMRSKGLQPGEELLPDDVPEEAMESAQPVANEEIVAQLVSMGFSQLHCQKAAINTSNTGVEEAMTWLLSHMDDPDIDAPISHQKSDVDQSSVDTLISFGFAEEVARKALKASGGDIEKATDWIFNNPNASLSDMDVSSSSSALTPAESALPDGGGRYKLFGIVSHMGTSTHCGHYVAHILKEGRWVIFNDSKVGISTNPPKDMGYLYFFQRLDN